MEQKLEISFNNSKKSYVIFTAYKDTKIMGTTTVAAAIINIAVNILLIYKFGLFAAAVSTLVANFIVYVYRKVKVKKYIILQENIFETIFSIVVIILVWGLFYSENIIFQGIGCIISMLYAVIANRKIITMIGRKLLKKS